jgi:hypothetical protein
LLFPDVLFTLLDRVPPRTQATVLGWRVAALQGRPYPVLVPGEGYAHGQLITELTANEWHLLDAFEDPVYDLRRITLTDSRHGWTYACLDIGQALPENWDIAQFVRQHLRTYLDSCAAWRRRYTFPVPPTAPAR